MRLAGTPLAVQVRHGRPTYSGVRGFSRGGRSTQVGALILARAVPESVLAACFDVAIRAPSSHNLEIWRFLDVRTPETRAALNHLCLDQPQAQQAANLIVAVARPDLWRLGAKRMLARLQADAREGTADADYRAWLPRLKKKYELMVPLLFADGPLHVLAPAKAALLWAIGQFRPMMRGPFGRSEQQMWAIKTTALACENFMLALAAAGYDSCPLEGFDEPKVKRLFALPDEARVVMVIAAGRRGPQALIPQVRHERAFYVERV
ncbi:MAG TPA: nitroreductase family protein [Polyangiaceae bacterium]